MTNFYFNLSRFLQFSPIQRLFCLKSFNTKLFDGKIWLVYSFALYCCNLTKKSSKYGLFTFYFIPLQFDRKIHLYQNFYHTVQNLQILSKNSAMIFKKKLGENSRNCRVLHFLSVDSFDFTRKIVEKLVKMLGDWHILSY